MSAKSIVIVDDHPIFRGALSQSLSTGSHSGLGMVSVLEAGSLTELTTVLQETGDVDLILLDLTCLLYTSPSPRDRG